MTLPIRLSDIQFGERDALHEFMKQDRQNLEILDNSFVDPPRVKLSDLENASRYLIVGPKGSGKTTLLWHLKRKAAHSRSKLLLFKSDLRKEDRDRLDRMVDLIVVEGQRGVEVKADYRTVWEWYLLKTLFTLIESDDLFDGHGLYHDIRNLLDIKSNRINTIYDNFHTESIKGKIKLSLGYGPLKSELAGEVNARNDGGNMDLLDLIRLIQNVAGKVRLRESVSIRLYVDELEFFMSKDGDGERDRRLVRDLIFAMHSINSLFAIARCDIAVLASLRSEILNSLSSSSQEVEKIVDAFGVKLNWYHKDSNDHPVLKIFENKIIYSEIGMEGGYSKDVWQSYFPPAVDGQSIKSYLLDLGLHRPRGVVLRLTAALEVAEPAGPFTEQNFIDSEEIFGRYMMQEFVDEISSAYNETEMSSIMSLFRGFTYAFHIGEVRRRRGIISNRGGRPNKFLHNLDIEQVLRLLYRIGMIGNQFYLENESSTRLRRDHWSFRGDFEPIIEQRFVIHKSIRKVMQTT